MISAVVVAAGSSRRMGKDKLALTLNDKPVFLYCLEVFESHPLIQEIIVVTQLDKQTWFQNQISPQFVKIKKWVEGGQERQHSVWNGLQAVNLKSELVLIHDAARPLVTASILNAVIQAAQKTGAAVCGTAIVDTIKEVDLNSVVTKTLDRSRLVAVQTPQIFEANLIRAAYQDLIETNEVLTDDTAVVERLGKSVQVVICEDLNFKITKPQDVALAESVLKSRQA